MKTIHKIKNWLNPVQDMPLWITCLRLLLVVIMLMLAYCMAQQNNPFFYQAF